MLQSFNTILLFGEYMKIFETHQLDDPRVPFILFDYTYTAGEYLGFSNWHENVELLYITRGRAVVTVNSVRQELSAGEVAIINSNYLHDIYAPEDMHFYCLIVDRSFCLANHIDTNDISFTATVRDTELCAALDAFVAEYKSEGRAYRILTMRAIGLGIMSLLCSRYSIKDAGDEINTPLMTSVKRVLGYIHAHSHEQITLDEVSEIAGFSKFYFAREFRRITGYTVIDYINNLRCKKARLLLLESKMSISAIAKECGFQNLSYFTRTFRAIEGELPSEYRRRFLTKG